MGVLHYLMTTHDMAICQPWNTCTYMYINLDHLGPSESLTMWSMGSVFDLSTAPRVFISV